MISTFKFVSAICAVVFLVLILVYLVVPSPKFPLPTPDSVQSLEKADVETPLRRAYFTNFSREQILKHYEGEFSKRIPIPIFSYRVYYPPEDAQILIRDQTRSVNLPEIIHPFRESLFVNTFEAQSPKDAISYRGVAYDRKITVRYVPSAPIVRILTAFLGSVLLLYLIKEMICEISVFARKAF